MMRCLFRHLPRDRITTPTKVSKSEERFARAYGTKFVQFAREHDAIYFTRRNNKPNIARIKKDIILAVLNKWFRARVTEDSNAFQWKDFYMTSTEIQTATQAAYNDWLEGHR